ncbi:MAG: polyprenyl synthetase family protein [Candidatus Latescibacterota bacterium]|nr:MAG: polyprenyl synthetase family protein [Candidatus Latescibacterota bacterium]
MLQAIKKYDSMKTVIEKCNTKVLEVLESSNVREAKIAAESFKNGGKRLRPALMILSSLAPTGGPIATVKPQLIDLAAAVELVHLATLFHDDVIDEVETRRMQRSARAKYGNHASVLAGDFVLAEALLLVQRSELKHTLPEFLRTIRVLIQGESRETAHKFDFDINEAAYFEIISEKSASLFSLSCKVGGLSYHSEYSDLLGHFGWNLGMAFQMIDDLDDMLDLPRGMMDCDLKNGYLALPVIRTLNQLGDGNRQSFVDIIRTGDFTREKEKQIVLLCRDNGGFDRTTAEIHKHLDRARQTLDRFEADGEAKDLLNSVVVDLKSYADLQMDGFVEFSEAHS